MEVPKNRDNEEKDACFEFSFLHLSLNIQSLPEDVWRQCLCQLLYFIGTLAWETGSIHTRLQDANSCTAHKRMCGINLSTSLTSGSHEHFR